MNRQWLCNVVNSVVGKPFADWVDVMVRERNESLKVKNDFQIAMDPQIAKAFHASSSISST